MEGCILVSDFSTKSMFNIEGKANVPPNMLIQDHMLITFSKIFYPICLHGTTRLGPLGYSAVSESIKNYIMRYVNIRGKPNFPSNMLL